MNLGVSFAARILTDSNNKKYAHELKALSTDTGFRDLNFGGDYKTQEFSSFQD